MECWTGFTRASFHSTTEADRVGWLAIKIGQLVKVGLEIKQFMAAAVGERMIERRGPLRRSSPSERGIVLRAKQLTLSIELLTNQIGLGVLPLDLTLVFQE